MTSPCPPSLTHTPTLKGEFPVLRAGRELTTPAGKHCFAMFSSIDLRSCPCGHLKTGGEVLRGPLLNSE